MPEYIQDTRNFFQKIWERLRRPNRKTILIIAGITLIVFLVILLGYLMMSSSNKLGLGLITSRRQGISPILAQRPIYALPAGKQVYRFTHGPDVKGPKPQVLTIDPLTPAKDQEQSFSVTIKNDSPVTHAAIRLITDSGGTNHSLKLIAGSNTDGTWQGKWIIKGTYNYVYRIKFDLRSKTGNYEETMAFR